MRLSKLFGSRESFFVLCTTFLATALTNFDAAFLYDDLPNITQNAAVTGFSPGSWAAWWRVIAESPALARAVANLSFAWQWWLSPESPAAFHLFNDLLHALAALAVFFLTQLLLEVHGPARWSGRTRTELAIFGALLWALHPIQTQAVTYAVQRMSVLAGLFSALCLLAYLRARHRDWRAGYGWAALCYGLALLSKENAAVLPVIAVLYELTIAPAEPSQVRRRRWAALALACVPPLVIAGWYAAQSAAHFSLGVLPNRDFTLGERLLSAPRMYLRYAGDLALPVRLALDHPVSASRGLFDPWTTLPSLLIVGMGAAVATRAGRRGSAAAFCALAAALALLPETSFLNLRLYFEHRLYLPSLFVLPFVPAGMLSLAEKRLPDLPPRRLAAAGVLVLAFCAAASAARNRDWRTPVSLWQSNVAVYPQSATAQTNLGSALIDEGKVAQALPSLEEAARLDPGDAGIRYNLGRGYFGVEQYAKAESELRACLKLNANYPDAAHLMALTMERQGRVDEAASFYKRALDTNPSDEAAAANYRAFLQEQTQ